MMRRHRSLVLELTERCNHDCLHCYNCWKAAAGGAPCAEMPTADTLATYDRLLDESGADLVSLSGGEPMLRPDFLEIADHLASRGVSLNLITNGSMLDAGAIERLAGRISVYELPLLSHRREVHDRLSGRQGAFDDVTRALATLKARDERAVGVFVLTALNLEDAERTLELAFALGLDGVMLNRFNPGGRGLANQDMLAVPPEGVARALDIAQAAVERWNMPVSCSIPMPPCLFDHSRWPGLGFGFCSAGTERAYYTVDPLGRLRPCNHSPTALGDLREKGFWEIVDSPAAQAFARARPDFCRGCHIEDECLGGCKAAAEADCGSVCGLDPYLRRYGDLARKPVG